ncbi:uroporphyrinogen-III C-methyltransferase [Aromatoleum anaerobium]|nr:uroporphyrinogen-III C-methyltransferase [Aromatoleum anaerobium]MCK0506872.1 uroporphyrinogen-III C-methyltransferase [Aromatoleum anaerobium]
MALVALAAAGLAGWQVYALRSGVIEIREEVAQRLAASDSALAEARGSARQQQESIASLQGKIGALEAHVAATEGQAAALENLYQEFSRTRDDRIVAEAEQAIGIAAQQLQLAGNHEAALIALQGAEARLAAQDRGQFQALRRALVRDIERLQTAPQVDVPGIALRLEALLERVDTLPLAFAGQLDDPATARNGASAPERASTDPSVIDFITGLARDIWREMLTLVRIERLDQSQPVLLAPAQSTYLRENLKIRLLTARLALLARDGRTFAADLAQARGWIERFFDQRDPAVQETLAELAALQALPVKVEQPTPTESIAALRMLQARSAEGRRPLNGTPAPGGAAASATGRSPGGAASAPATQPAPVPPAQPREQAPAAGER